MRKNVCPWDKLQYKDVCSPAFIQHCTRLVNADKKNT